jgi:hypothetical protein
MSVIEEAFNPLPHPPRDRIKLRSCINLDGIPELEYKYPEGSLRNLAESVSSFTSMRPTRSPPSPHTVQVPCGQLAMPT